MNIIGFRNERELQKDLSKFLSERDFITFTEIELKSKAKTAGRADVVALKPSYANKDCRIYEVKNNRPCFLEDTKYLKYQDWCHRLYIACPKGMIKKDEVPNNIGLIVRNETAWRVIKQPKTNYPIYLEDSDFLLSLIYRGFESFKYQRSLENRIIAEKNVSLKKQAKRIGEKIAIAISRNKEVNREDWSLQIANIFKQYLGIEPYSYIRDSDNLINPQQLERVLKDVKPYVENAETIRDIGAYLDSLSFNLRGYQDIKNKINNFKKGGTK